jgi:hypothetical protein
MRTPLSHENLATSWMAELARLLANTVPEPFTFALVLFRPEDPLGALMLSPEEPPVVAAVCGKLAATIESGAQPTLVLRPGEAWDA